MASTGQRVIVEEAPGCRREAANKKGPISVNLAGQDAVNLAGQDTGLNGLLSTSSGSFSRFSCL
jgi:hypothetical protein